MFKLDSEKAEEPEIKLPTSVGSSKKQESSKRTSTSALLTMPKPLTLWITTNYISLPKVNSLAGSLRWIFPTALKVGVHGALCDAAQLHELQRLIGAASACTGAQDAWP